MPRAHRYFLPNHIWRITHRCHQRAFLLKFARQKWGHAVEPMESPVCHMAVVSDPDGNSVTIHRRKAL